MLLTRPPLSSNRSYLLVRLACVRRAASVRSEPGSNSQVEQGTFMVPKNHNPLHNQKIFLTPISRCAQEFTDATSLEVAGYIRGLLNLRSILEIQTMIIPDHRPHLPSIPQCQRAKSASVSDPWVCPGRCPVGVSRLALHPVGGGGL